MNVFHFLFLRRFLFFPPLPFDGSPKPKFFFAKRHEKKHMRLSSPFCAPRGILPTSSEDLSLFPILYRTLPESHILLVTATVITGPLTPPIAHFPVPDLPSEPRPRAVPSLSDRRATTPFISACLRDACQVFSPPCSSIFFPAFLLSFPLPATAPTSIRNEATQWFRSESGLLSPLHRG